MNEYYSVVRSPEYLEHFGILGMKWGIRRFQNKDGSLTPEGMARYRKTTNALQKDLIKKTLEGIHANTSDMSGVEKLFSMTGASKDSMNKAYDICESYTKEIKDLSKECDNLVNGLDKGTRAYYEAATEISSTALYYNKSPEDLTIEDIGNNGFMGCLEDGQQQSVNAISYYIHETGQTEKARNVEKKYSDISSNSRDALKETLSSAFDEVGADELDKNYRLSNSLSTTMMYKFETKNHAMSDGFYQVVYSEGGHNYTEKELNSVDEAKKVVDHFDGNHDSNTWWYVNEAAENLGMSNIKASEMTQADWDRLNAEIRDLRSARHSAMTEDEYLEHHGILGQRWGIRRYQNPDGSLTEEGKRRYGDILTPDQMKKIIHDYNLRTGQNKKLNKKTVFKTSHGMYDYKGRRLNDDTDVAGPDKNSKKSESKEDSRRTEISEMSTEEIRNANARMEAEIDYIRKYNQLHPQQVSAAKQIVENLKSHLINDIPAGISQGVKQYIANSIADLADDGKSGSGDKKSGKKKKTNVQNQTTAQKAANTVKNMSAVKETAEAVKDIAKEYNDTKAAMANAAANARSAATNASNNARSVVNDTKQMFRDKVSNADFEDSIVDDEFIRLYKERYKPLL